MSQSFRISAWDGPFGQNDIDDLSRMAARRPPEIEIVGKQGLMDVGEFGLRTRLSRQPHQGWQVFIDRRGSVLR